MNDPLNLKICSIVMHYSPETVDDGAQLLFSVIGQTEVNRDAVAVGSEGV